MTEFNWVCPYCNHAQVVGSARLDISTHHIYIDNLSDGSVSYTVGSVGCANNECKKLTLSFTLFSDRSIQAGYVRVSNKSDLLFRRLLPNGLAKPQPDFIPKPLREDYNEACEIAVLSPKAAATLARRCLQGMIRDFCGIAKDTLDQEIKTLDKMILEGTAPHSVSVESVQAIDQVRRIGNIGAHMEKDINLIIPVEFDEAQALISLLELLFDEWYVARESRGKRLTRIAEIAAEKRLAIASARGSQAILAPPVVDNS